MSVVGHDIHQYYISHGYVWYNNYLGVSPPAALIADTNIVCNICTSCFCSTPSIGSTWVLGLTYRRRVHESEFDLVVICDWQSYLCYLVGCKCVMKGTWCLCKSFRTAFVDQVGMGSFC